MAGLLPLIAYAPNNFEPEVRSLVELLENQAIEGGFAVWPELLDWGAWWLGYATGAFALFHESWPALVPLLKATFANVNEYERHLIEPVRENIGQELGKLVMARFSGTDWMSPRWEHLLWSLSNNRVLQERWPEFLQGKEPKVPALANFDFLVSLRVGLEGEEALAYWMIYRGGGVPLARRLRNDSRYREEIADLLDTDSISFLADVNEAVPGRVRLAGRGFSESAALSALLADQ